MYQILLVDDEASVVDSLALRIPWNQLEISEVHRAYSAQEAIEIFRANTIDIVITDIRMPGINGIELISTLHSLKSKAKCILLSGYAEFEYAEQAIRNKAASYLVKPISNEDVINTIKSLVADLKKEWAAISSYQNTLNTLRDNLPAIKKSLLNDVLQGNSIDTDMLLGKLEMLDLNFSADRRICMMLIRIDDKFHSFDLNSMDLLEFAICNIADELFSENFELWQGKDRYGYLVYIITQKKKNDITLENEEYLDSSLLTSTGMELQRNVNNYLKGTISVFISDWVAFPQEITQTYENLLLEIRRIGTNVCEFFFAESNKRNNFPERKITSLKSLHESPILILLEMILSIFPKEIHSILRCS